MTGRTALFVPGPTNTPTESCPLVPNENARAALLDLVKAEFDRTADKDRWLPSLRLSSNCVAARFGTVGRPCGKALPGLVFALNCLLPRAIHFLSG